MPNYTYSALPLPPPTYDVSYHMELIRVLNIYFTQLQNPGAQVCSYLRIINVLTDPGNEPLGTVWHDTTENVLRIIDSSYVRVPLTGSSMTASRGTVTP